QPIRQLIADARKRGWIAGDAGQPDEPKAPPPDRPPLPPLPLGDPIYTDGGTWILFPRGEQLTRGRSRRQTRRPPEMVTPRTRKPARTVTPDATFGRVLGAQVDLHYRETPLIFDASFGHGMWRPSGTAPTSPWTSAP